MSRPCLLVFLLGIGLLHAEPSLYTCGMHPQIIKQEPGDCPICGMALTPVRPNGAATESVIQIDQATVQRMNLKTALVEAGPLHRQLRTVGTVAFNEASFHDITLRYEAWVEKLHVSSTWTYVKAGDPLLDVYSPDLYNAELNYIVARQTEGESGGPLTQAALTRLQLLELPAEEIAQLASSLQAPRTTSVRARHSGWVVEKMVLPGQMMKPGERLFRLAELDSVWVLAQVFENDLAFVKEGQDATVRLRYGSGAEFSGKIERLLPQLDEQTRSVTARIVLANPGLSLRPGMYAEVILHSQPIEKAILVPESAVLRSGEMNTVFVAKDGGYFEPRELRLGLRGDGGVYEVLGGLSVGERIVTSGQFLLDSESQLREAIQKMLKGSSSGGPVQTAPQAASPQPHAHGTTAAPLDPAPAAPAAPAATANPALPPLYTCPMEEHAHVVSETPGRCPECKMKLVLTTTVEHGKALEEAWLKAHATRKP